VTSIQFLNWLAGTASVKSPECGFGPLPPGIDVPLFAIGKGEPRIHFE